MTEKQEALFGKAHQALATARNVVEQGDVDAAINRAYYASFYAGTAALLAVGETPKTHSGTDNRSHHHFVKTGRISDDTGRILRKAQRARDRADYDAFATFEEKRAVDLIRDVEIFVDAVEELVASPE